MQQRSAYVLKLKPNKKQISIIEQSISNNRFVWNKFVAMLQNRYISAKEFEKRHPNNNKKVKTMFTAFDLGYLLKPLKNEYPKLKVSDSTIYQNVAAKIVQTYDMFFKKQGGKPHFHNWRNAKQSYTGSAVGALNKPECRSARVIGKYYLKLPKLGVIKVSKTTVMPDDSVIKTYTITRNPDWTYTVSLSIVSEKLRKLPEPTHDAVGIDVGLENLANLSDGTKIAPFKYEAKEKQATHAQRLMSRRRDKASRLAMRNPSGKGLYDYQNWQRMRGVKFNYQRELAAARKDYLDRITTQIVTKYKIIAIEDLCIKNMMKNHHLARSIANQSWYQFRSMLEYKCKRYGRKLIVVNAKNTSRICSNCGFNSGEKPLNIREWTCPECNAHHDRDINAAINIKNKALEKTV